MDHLGFLVALTVLLPIALATLGFYIAYRLAEDYLIVPRIMGRTVEVPAVVTVLAEVAFRRLDSS